MASIDRSQFTGVGGREGRIHRGISFPDLGLEHVSDIGAMFLRFGYEIE